MNFSILLSIISHCRGKVAWFPWSIVALCEKKSFYFDQNGPKMDQNWPKKLQFFSFSRENLKIMQFLGEKWVKIWKLSPFLAWNLQISRQKVQFFHFLARKSAKILHFWAQNLKKKIANFGSILPRDIVDHFWPKMDQKLTKIGKTMWQFMFFYPCTVWPNSQKGALPK